MTHVPSQRRLSSRVTLGDSLKKPLQLLPSVPYTLAHLRSSDESLLPISPERLLGALDVDDVESQISNCFFLREKLGASRRWNHLDKSPVSFSPIDGWQNARDQESVVHEPLTS